MREGEHQGLTLSVANDHGAKVPTMEEFEATPDKYNRGLCDYWR